jgi:hypothetical protein
VLVLPGIAAHLKGLVVHPATGIQDALQPGTLALGWIQAELEGLSHMVIVSYLVLERKFYKQSGAFTTLLKEGVLCVIFYRGSRVNVSAQA